MSKADTEHTELMSGLRIEGGIPPSSNPQVPLQKVEGGGGTLTGLALRKNTTGAPTPVLVSCQHVVVGKRLSYPPNVYAYKVADGRECIYYPDASSATHRVSGAIDAVALTDHNNRVDLATCAVLPNVEVGYLLHDPSHSGTGRTGSGAHAVRKIVRGTVTPEIGTEVTLLGAKAGEGTARITAVDVDRHPAAGKFFDGVMEMDAPTRNTALGEEDFGGGDSGGPVLKKITEGVYRMVGIIFAIKYKEVNGETKADKVYAFPASAAQTAAGITFGEPLPPVPSLNEMDSFANHAYGDWRALTDFDDVEHRLHNVDLYNSRVRWLGSSVPGAGPNYHWWSVGVPSGNENPTSVRFSVRGSPEIDEDFAQGRRWGFKVYVRHQGATAWTHAFSGEDVLSATGYTSGEDEKPIVLAGFEVPITNSADAIREYFQPYRNGEFEVRIEGAPANRAPIAKAVATPNPAAARSEVTLDASGSTDPDGDALTHSWEQPTEAGGDATTNRVALTGANTAEASFDAPASPQTLAFTLTVEDPSGLAAQDTVDVVVLGPGLESLGTLTEGDTTARGSWSSNVASVHRSDRYARYYAFRLNSRGRVRLTLSSSVDTYMYLLAGAGKSGEVVQSNDDYDYLNTLDSRITQTLDAGDYTVEATAFWPRRLGDFELVAHLISVDATLSGLSLSAGELAPAFDAGVTSYTAPVEHTRNTITVTPTASNRDATITVNGVATASGAASVALSLVVGENAIAVVVTAEDGTQRTYTVTVTRAAYSAAASPTPTTPAPTTPAPTTPAPTTPAPTTPTPTPRADADPLAAPSGVPGRTRTRRGDAAGPA